MEYILAFLTSAFFNTWPFFAPGTGFVISYFYITYNIPIIPLALVIVLGSILGRYILAKYTSKIVSKFAHDERNENLSYFRDHVNKKPVSAFFFCFIYSALPTPSNLLFLSLGAANTNMLPILLGFGFGRFINYIYSALSINYVYQKMHTSINGSFSLANILSQILTILLFTVFLLVDWKSLILHRKFRLVFNFNSKKESTVVSIPTYHMDEEMVVSDMSKDNIEGMYNKGFKFTRKGYGNMQSTKNLRIDLSKFYIFTKNKRVLSKYPNISMSITNLPLNDYSYTLGKLAKDFYDTKFGKGVFSVAKIKELLTSDKSNFNTLLEFSVDGKKVGYVISYMSDNILHYSYPFYDLSFEASYLGIAMMTKAISEAKEKEIKYVYLGGVNASKDAYKLQFKGMEWWNKDHWDQNIDVLKEIIKNINNIK